MIMKVRLESMYKRRKNLKYKNIGERYDLSKKYFDFLSSRTHQKTFKIEKI